MIKPGRQRRWQKRMKAQGRCTICGKPSVTANFCEYHRQMTNNNSNKKNAIKRLATPKPYIPQGVTTGCKKCTYQEVEPNGLCYACNENSSALTSLNQ